MITIENVEPMSLDDILQEELNNKALESALFLKQYCKTNHCRNCQFWNKEDKWCKLETKKEYNLNSVPKDWDI